MLILSGAPALPAIACWLLLLAPSVAAMTLSRRESSSSLERRNYEYGFYNVTAAGGSFLTILAGLPSLGEPLNAIVSGDSDASVIGFPDVFEDWALSVGFGQECLGQHLGAAQKANLGDGRGPHNETRVLRWTYGDPYYGTCKETVDGGNHFRYWVQNGSTHYTGAIFMAVSYELPLSVGHDIQRNPNGYDAGRDQLVGNATIEGGTKSPLTNRTFTTAAQMVSGFLPANSSNDINHGLEIDGQIAVLTVRMTSPGDAATLQSSAPETPQRAIAAAVLGIVACVTLII